MYVSCFVTTNRPQSRLPQEPAAWPTPDRPVPGTVTLHAALSDMYDCRVPNVVNRGWRWVLRNVLSLTSGARVASGARWWLQPIRVARLHGLGERLIGCEWLNSQSRAFSAFAVVLSLQRRPLRTPRSRSPRSTKVLCIDTTSILSRKKLVPSINEAWQFP